MEYKLFLINIFYFEILELFFILMVRNKTNYITKIFKIYVTNKLYILFPINNLNFLFKIWLIYYYI